MKKTVEFSLDDVNNTNYDLILLYMYILPKFATHGIKVGMVKCKKVEIFGIVIIRG